VNSAAVDDPSLVNSDPMGQGWLFKLEVSDVASWISCSVSRPTASSPNEAVELEHAIPEEEFADRHIGPTVEEAAAMLASLGVASIEQLIGEALPESIRSARSLDVGPRLSEREALAHLAQLAAENRIVTPLIGMGITAPWCRRSSSATSGEPCVVYGLHPVSARNQPGPAGSVAEFSNHGVRLDGPRRGQRVAARRSHGGRGGDGAGQARATSTSSSFLVDAHVHPQTLSVLRTRAEPLGWEIVVVDEPGGFSRPCFGAVLQYPARTDMCRISSRRRRRSRARRRCGDGGGSLGADPPEAAGEIGADVAIGSTQRFGVPLGCGGPHAAYIAVKQAYQRNLPGRLVGVSVDANGTPAYRLALQTREQHIRRDKATSNICTAQVLLAVAASMYAVYHGPDGLRRIALAIHGRAAILAAGLRRLGVRILNHSFFDTLTVEGGADPERILEQARMEGLAFRVIDAGPPGVAPRGPADPLRKAPAFGMSLMKPAATRPWKRSGDASVAPSSSTRCAPAIPAPCPRRCAGPHPTSRIPCSISTAPKPRCCATCGA